MEYEISILWDPEAQVWIAYSSDVSGLALESYNIEVLIERVKLAVPELLSLNKKPIPRSLTPIIKCDL
ncbi:MAG: DUF1902 domain-containing protein [Clostridiaceae bacterium]|jgi:hypothetical protein|nr:DUF1902 domain-containing protein [Clostridiaceae bacterium]